MGEQYTMREVQTVVTNVELRPTAAAVEVIASQAGATCFGGTVGWAYRFSWVGEISARCFGAKACQEGKIE